MKLRIDKQDTQKGQLKIPKGYRLIEDYEACKEYRTNKKLKELMLKEWIWVNTINGTRAAGLYYVGGGFLVVGLDDLNYCGRSRGVFVKKVGR